VPRKPPLTAAALSRTQPAFASLPPLSRHTAPALGLLVTRLMQRASCTFPFSETVKLTVILLPVAAKFGTQDCEAAGVTPSAPAATVSATSTISTTSTTAAPVATFTGAATLLGYSWILVGVGGFMALGL
jgi:hypothetical protein